MAANGSDGSLPRLRMLFDRFGNDRLAEELIDEKLTEERRETLMLLQQCDHALEMDSIELDQIKLSFYKFVFGLSKLDCFKDRKFILSCMNHSLLSSFSKLLQQFEGNKEEWHRFSGIRAPITEILKKGSPKMDSVRVSVVWTKMGAECLGDVLKNQNISPGLRNILQAIQSHDVAGDSYVFSKLFSQTRMTLGLINLVDITNSESLTVKAKIVLQCMEVSGLSSLRAVIHEFKKYYDRNPLLCISAQKCDDLLELIEGFICQKNRGSM